MKKIVIPLVLLFLLVVFVDLAPGVEEIKYYPDFLKLVEEDKIKEVKFHENTLYASLEDGETIRTVKPREEDIYKLLMEKEIPFSANSSFRRRDYPSFIVSLVVIGTLLYSIKYMKGATANFQSDTEKSSKTYSDVTFDHVAGIDEEKYELQEIVEFLKNPDKYFEIGARIPRGVLLTGPPGTGKTLLAKAVAGEAEVPFYSTSGSSFAELFVGMGPLRVRKLFEKAKKNAPSIVFIDEIDSVGKQRGLDSVNTERENTLNQLLVEMDGFDSHQAVVVIAATNRIDMLDPALLRPGRFDKHIHVGPPDVKGREEILKVHIQGKPLDGNVDLEVLAKQTSGFTGADLENLVNEAALIALKKDKNKITMDDLEEAITKVIAGTEKPNKVISDHERKVTAYHEAGHALVGHLLDNKIHKISIIPRGMAGGYTLILPEKNNYYSKSQLLNKIKTLLAGRAAEEIIFGEVTTGAQNDLERSTSLVKQMVTKYGMGSFGPITFEEDKFTKPFSESTAQMIDKEIRDIINTCYEEVKELLNKNKIKLKALAESLIEKETLGADEVNDILK